MSNVSVHYKVKTASEKDLGAHLYACNDNFNQPLSQRVNIEEYAQKIFKNAITFEAWLDGELVGLVSAYFNDSNNPSSGFITNVSVKIDFMGKGLATTLMNNCLDYAQKLNIKKISLEVSSDNNSAIRFYKKFGFTEIETQGNSVIMNKL